MSKPWGSIGAWALESERAEAEERELAVGDAPPPHSFPSLKEAVAAASKPKKKKPVAIPLTQFVADPQLDLRLPTGPRERGPEEHEFAGRRGFAGSYGGGYGVGSRRGGFDGEPRRRGAPPSSSVSEMEIASSRADEVDNWAFAKKQLDPIDNRYGGYGSGSRADEVDNWAIGKKQFGTVDRRQGQDRYASLGGGARADEVDNWALGKKPLQSFGSSFGSSSNGERKRLVLDPPKKDGEGLRSQTRVGPSPFGAARPREEVLAEKGLDWRKIDLEIETKTTSRPTSSHSSRPASAQSSRPGSSGSQMGEGGVKVKPRVNPFGDAKPREVLLEAKGKDWRKIDMELEHRGVDRPETDEEKTLKDEIKHLKSQEESMKSEPLQISAEELAVLQEQILHKERELELLIRQLDDKVRFGQKALGNTRPTSGAGRFGTPTDSRPHSRSGVSEGSRSSEFMERPQSRGGGTAYAWLKPTDDRRGFESRYFGDRSLDRPKSRERW